MNSENYDSSDISIIQDPSILSIYELADEYQKLSTSYMQYKVLVDHCKQQVYSLKQDKELKDKILDQELQVLTENFESELKETKIKHSIQIGELQSRLTDARTAIEKLELENQQLQTELTSKVNELTLKPCPQSNVVNENETIVTKKRLEYLTKIETDFMELTEELAAIKSEKSQLMSQLAQKEVRFDQMQICLAHFKFINYYLIIFSFFSFFYLFFYFFFLFQLGRVN